ncbi:ABC transporter substrate-binding protein [Ethanoligenens harbinense]|uniref:ABC-type Fe3+ transport system periplasmic component-like protein n=1 Tax=Ethanoligenens harbinense (strain DSM 18485 / JCM 12961 / CGMCC 1.5033 / YUAN-3) TaxID=663278 RepID=E6U3L0_ETHHY|nr:ABC transporter substrate-binding protein [Ethanoligenens harbinense]ADU27610.1 ABC-type Fe3+ transport system periplasmic component-like protein [Ethanoligenens harbinense YUAN-3]AVQ96654.1 hypothetical protein CXQ68_10715 [Ethanoligenens harbinense YUAN-3]AYF39313.1 hypothetical protein CXP51_10605 [Ethanoligenens harbinense]AYF42139.1 hypothetical protein CN246_11155 [Ethanoligenens harbinense]QCN92894.1 hypothetical protein DRA42_10745 [Ethanoligenens harbinense]
MSSTQSAVQVEDYAVGGLSFFGLLPCPVKVPFEDRFRTFARRTFTEQGRRLAYYIEGNANHHVPFRDYLNTVEDPDRLPDILLAPGYNMFFEKNFQQRFVRTGVFSDCLAYEPSLLENGLRDPGGNYSLLAMNTLVIMADETRAPFVPESWDDLLDERLEKQLGVRGDGKSFCDALLTYFDKHYGEDGIRRLARSVQEGMHPAQAVVQLTRPKPGQPSVYVVPYFYARTVQNPNARIIWPKEGALLNPVFLMVKTGKAGEHKEILEFLTGPETAAAFNCAGLFSTCAGADQTLLKDRTYHWIGWEYLSNPDIGDVLAGLNPLFLRYYR